MEQVQAYPTHLSPVSEEMNPYREFVAKIFSLRPVTQEAAHVYRRALPLHAHPLLCDA